MKILKVNYDVYLRVFTIAASFGVYILFMSLALALWIVGCLAGAGALLRVSGDDEKFGSLQALAVTFVFAMGKY